MKNQAIFKTFKSEKAALGWLNQNKHRLDPHSVRIYKETGISYFGYYEDYVLKFSLSPVRLSRTCFNCGDEAKGKKLYGCDVCLYCRKKRDQGFSFEEIRKLKKEQ